MPLALLAYSNSEEAEPNKVSHATKVERYRVKLNHEFARSKVSHARLVNNVWSNRSITSWPRW